MACLSFVTLTQFSSLIQCDFSVENNQYPSEMNHETALRSLPHTHVTFHHVETACAEDVKKFCEESLPKSTGDPFLDWLFLPMFPSPVEFRDISFIMDRIFDPEFIEPSREFVTLFWVDEPQHAPQFLIDSVAAKAAQERQPEEIPQLANDLKKYGNQVLLTHDQDSFQYRMARRLTEMDTTTIQLDVHLPFGCAKNRCLRQALADGKLSPRCKESIQELENTFALEVEQEYRQELFLGMMWIYIATLCFLLFQLARKMQSQRSKRQLRMRILQAVYSNPNIKRQVEGDLGESVGAVPPVSLHALSLMGRDGQDLKRALRCIRRAHIIVFASLLTLIVVAPFWVMPICIVFSVVRALELCFLPNHVGDGECECCCCGANTNDAKNGTLTEQQECCSCCKGTGVCTPSCADCCGPKSTFSNSCGDVMESCCCKKNLQIEECTCCCCGATPSKARTGTLTSTQVCCTCCQGTGVCADACDKCCGTGGCCCCCCGVTEAQAREGNLTDAQACCCCCRGTGKGCTCCSSNSKTNSTIQECTCCCCGATPSQARDGTLSVDQVCCNCCKGSGVCCNACASCCGNGCCCGGDGDEQPQSCALKGRGQKHVVSARNEIYCGVPLQVV